MGPRALPKLANQLYSMAWMRYLDYAPAGMAGNRAGNSSTFHMSWHALLHMRMHGVEAAAAATLERSAQRESEVQSAR